MRRTILGLASTRAVSRAAAVSVLATLVACSTSAPSGADNASLAVRLIAFNDFHGHLEPTRLAIPAPGADGAMTAVPAGGAAYLAGAIARLKSANPNHAVISAGDMIGASPLVSALFLDEPTIEAFNMIGIDFNAVGNHEFDRGQAELLRMQRGGCTKHTALEPCRINKAFPGANFTFLAANTVRTDGSTLFPATAIKAFSANGHSVKVGFIGLTLRGTPAIVTPTGVAGLTFKDEAETANALIPALRAQGANTVVVVIHEGAITSGGYNDRNCPGLRGDLLPILDKLDRAVDLVISGHTHRAYVCDYGRINPDRPLLVTSAGQHGTLLTAIDLVIDARSGQVNSKRADNIIVQGAPFSAGSDNSINLSPHHPAFATERSVSELIARYSQASAPLAGRVVAHLAQPIGRAAAPSREHPLGNLIADAQLAATRTPSRGGAQIALMNPGGVRANLDYEAPGAVTYGQIFGVQPFGNSLVVKTFTGAQLRALLEQQFSGVNSIANPRVLMPSQGFSYAYDVSRPEGLRISDMRLNGKPIVDGGRYRVAMNSFLASGGDGFTVFVQGTEALGGDLDIDALEAYLAAHSPVQPPATDRITRKAP